MIRKQAGFTLVELMITMVIFLFAIAAASTMFTGLLTQFKQQSKIAESNIEGMIGLEIFRYDLEQAGYGLPWFVYDGANNVEDAWTDLVNYNEATADTYNDGAPASANPVPANVVRAPRAIVIGDDTELNGSDRIVIKATNIGVNDAAPKWTYIANRGAANYLRDWSTITHEKFASTDRVIVIKPEFGTRQRFLVTTGGGVFFTQMSDLPSFGAGGTNTSFEPVTDTFNAHIAYGINNGSAPRVPFNRADYYVPAVPASLPTRCEPSTSVLYKAVLNYADGNVINYPLVDCVLDMQVVVRLDTGAATNVDGMTAENIRGRVREIRIYIVVQEGQRDLTYNFTTIDPIACPGPGQRLCINDPDLGLVKNIQITNLNYRWKLYTLAITPFNLK